MLGFEVAAYVEAQIEQGQRLETAGVPIGVVTRIQGVRRFAVEVLGEAVHAGTMPRAHRRDALSATLAMVAEPERPTADPNDVVRFTVGRFAVDPARDPGRLLEHAAQPFGELGRRHGVQRRQGNALVARHGRWLLDAGRPV